MPVSILIAEGSFLSADLLSSALKRCQNHFDVVGHAGSCAEATKKLHDLKPQVALVSMSLRGANGGGYSLISHIREHLATTSVVALLEEAKREQVLEAFRCGAHGVISRDQPFRMLVKCIRKVHAGEIWASADQIGLVFESLKSNSELSSGRAAQSDLSQLTPRERDVAALVIEGLRNAEIGAKLGVSEHTVRNYIMKIYDKLGVSNRVQLTRQCAGLLQAPISS